MKVYINTDIEGVAGWVFYATFADTLSNFHHTQRMNRLLTNEVNAAVTAAFEAGADDVIICDGHGVAYHILFEELDPRCRIIHGRQGWGPSWTPLLDESVDACLAIGMHAMAATPGAVCPHSYWHLTTGDGAKIALSECTMFAALAGAMGIPMVAMSGDDKIAAEIHEKVPGCETAVVKEGLASQNCCTLMPKRACELIYEKTRAGLEKRSEIRPYRLQGPFALNLSDRDPAKKDLNEDMIGDDLFTLMHKVSSAFGNRWGEDPIDDRSWRFPTSIFTPV
jgi:D-amino peptidase